MAADLRAEFDEAWKAFFAAIRHARGRAVAEFEREGLSLAQFQLLHACAEGSGAEEITVGALANAADVAQPTATRMLDTLEREGIVERRPSSEDRRSVQVRLTPRGRRVLKRKRDLVQAKRSAVFNSLDEGERASAIRILNKLAEAISAESEPK